MPSPFPGMNPYFEQSAVWLDFHIEFLTALRRLLAPQIGPQYIVLPQQDIEEIPFLEVRDRLGRTDHGDRVAQPVEQTRRR